MQLNYKDLQDFLARLEDLDFNRLPQDLSLQLQALIIQAESLLDFHPEEEFNVFLGQIENTVPARLAS